MADEKPDDKKLSKKDSSELLTLARKQYDRAMDRERENIQLAYDDLEFMAGKQWPAGIAKERADESRPVLTINQMPQFVHQVTGDIRQMKPAIKVVPVDDEADPELADLRQGLIRYIENRSDASGIYFQGADSQVACGIGHWRVTSEYADDTTFEQELRIEGIDDQVSVLWDPDAKRMTREDAMFCFVPVDMTMDAFKFKYPDASMDEFEDVKTWSHYGDWKTDDTVRVAEYWIKKPKTLTLGLTPDGQTLDLTEDDEFEGGFTAKRKQEIAVANGVRIEKRESYEVCRYLITAANVLEGPEEWAGRYIPIVPVIGEEVKIGRKLIRRGIIREAKDPQRQYNYFASAQTEVVALQPKAPWLLTETNVAKYQGMWEQANSKNFPYLLWTPDAKNGNQQPSRVAPAVNSQGISEGLALANEDMRRVIGIYDASLGAKSNETSGVAIKARQREGDTGTIVYFDNFTRAVRQTGKILIDLIPHVYDTQRTIRIMGEDGKVDLMQINQERDKAGMPIVDPTTNQPVMLNDMTIGSYDVVAETGTSYATKREEARDSMLQFIQAAPDAAPAILDLVAKAMDWPLSEDVAERLHAILPPPILAAEKAKETEKTGQPPQIDPQQQAQQQMGEQAQQAQFAAGIDELKNKTAEDEAKVRKANADADKAEADAETAKINTQIALQKLHGGSIKALNENEAHEAGMVRDGQKHAVDIATRTDKHFRELDAADQAFDHGAEKHDATIQRMTQPPEQPSA